MGGREPVLHLDAAELLALRSRAAAFPPLLQDPAARPGSTPSARRGAGTDIREIRPYADGDDLRSIDAAATARRGAPHVRSFHEDHDTAVILIADFRRPMLWGTRGRLRSVAAAEALALVGWQVAEAGGTVGLVIATDEGAFTVRPKSRVRAMTPIAEELARAHELARAGLGRHETGTLTEALGLARAIAPRRGDFLLATALDPPEEGAGEAIEALVARGRLTALLTRDPFERERPRGSFGFVSEDGVARQGRFDAGASSAEKRAARLRAVGARVIVVDTDKDIAVELSAHDTRRAG